MADVICLDDLDKNGAEMDDPIAELEQDFYHRLIEEPGSNPDDPGRGFGLLSRLSDQVDENLAGDINAEGKKDDRIDRVETTVTETEAGVYDLEIDILPEGSLILQANTKTNTVTRLA